MALFILISGLTSAQIQQLPLPEASIPEGSSFVTFSVSGSNYTQPTAIDELGDVAGWVGGVSATGLLYHYAFFRTRDGVVNVFSVPSSDLQNGGSTPTALNAGGEMTGSFVDINSLVHGFLRTVGGAFVIFDPPGAVQTLPVGINSAGDIAGYFSDSALSSHGFIRDHTGAVIEFDVPGGAPGGTYPVGIDAHGDVAGFFFSPVYGQSGFFRNANGTFATFNVAASQFGTAPVLMNAGGTVTGSYFDSNFNLHGFVRSPDGNITTFTPFGSGYLRITGINDAGAVIGWYGLFGRQAFERLPNGLIMDINVPGVIAGEAGPTGINNFYQVIGSSFVYQTFGLEAYILNLGTVFQQ